MPGRFLGLRREQEPGRRRDGFVYAGDAEDGPMRDAREGAIVRVDGHGPPVIVVNHDPASVIVTRWPGRLWRVRIVEPSPPGDQPLPHARYTRALAVAVGQEADVATLFGPHGRDVVRVLDVAPKLDRPQAETLARHRHPQAPAAYDRVWRRWLKQAGIEGDFADLDGALALGGQGSPINQGLSLLHNLVFKRAQAMDGDRATEADDEDIWLAAPWDGAGTVLGDAALALGAPQAVGNVDRIILLQGWERVFG
ncbi:MAG: hypothetical protein V4574_19505 [Pseudomonadota bacterium]